MAHEITSWRERDCNLAVSVDSLTSRETYSREINEEFGEGGGLNANYQMVEAVAIVASMLATNGLRHGTHWIFKTAGNCAHFDFYDQKTKEEARRILLSNHAVLV